MAKLERRVRLVAPLMARSADEHHRASTPLELFFDLVFVVAIAQAAAELHHAVIGHHAIEGIISYVMVFFAIWWAWMTFTWFASAFDSDDVPYRLATFALLTGALILAAGVPAAFEGDWAVVTTGYVVMRIVMIAQWLRAGSANPTRRAAAIRYALGIGVAQVGWVGLLWVPAELKMIGFGSLVVVELLIPIWAERAVTTTWHAHHIAERYGLLTIIVLGESVLSATGGIQAALAAGESAAGLASLIGGGLLVIFSMWWLYFERPVHGLLTTMRRAFIWGYGHFLVFASAAAVGAGLAVSIEHATGHGDLSAYAVGAAVAVPVSLYLLSLWFLHHRPSEDRLPHLGLVAAALVLLTPLTDYAVVLTGLILATLLAARLLPQRTADQSATA